MVVGYWFLNESFHWSCDEDNGSWQSAFIGETKGMVGDLRELTSLLAEYVARPWLYIGTSAADMNVHHGYTALSSKFVEAAKDGGVMATSASGFYKNGAKSPGETCDSMHLTGDSPSTVEACCCALLKAMHALLIVRPYSPLWDLRGLGNGNGVTCKPLPTRRRSRRVNSRLGGGHFGRCQIRSTTSGTYGRTSAPMSAQAWRCRTRMVLVLLWLASMS